MKTECFLDTNILVYAAAGGGPDEHKQRRALELIETKAFALSAQVLQEFYVTVVRKIQAPLPPARALEWIEALEAFPCAIVDARLVKVAVALSLEHQVSYWDGAILAAAEEMGARTLYTEDLSHGRNYGTVTALNPFRDEGVPR